jgi:hypothetical protein
VDVARAGDVDWEAMMDDATEGILDQASMARRALEENPPPVPFADLKEAASGAPREGAEASTAHDAALEAFSAQPAIEQFNGEAREWVAARYGEDYPFQFERHRMHKLLFEVQDLGLEETVRRRRRQSVCPFAILKDGEWMARGDMGWWAAVSNEDADWPDIAFEVLTGLDDDATIICCDCHV